MAIFMQCTACRRDIPEESRFCPSCGSPIVGPDAATSTVPEHQRSPSADRINQAQFIPGSMLAGRYRIVGFLGRGGMGEVYRADDLELGQPVALKFLPTDVDRDAARLARFHQEVRLAREVSHPYVCRVYDIEEHDRSPTRWHILRTGQPAALSFWYRQSQNALVPATSKPETIGEVTRRQPPSIVPGMVSVLMDPRGRLTSLSAVPPQIEEPTDDRPPDWTTLFAEAGLPIARFSPARSTRSPSVYADARAAWEGVYPDQPEIRIRVEAAAARGRPVSFEIIAPWTRPQRLEPIRFPTAADRARYIFGASLGLLVSAGAVLLVRRNLRLGRGDRRGAFRLSLYLGTIGLLIGTLRAHHVADLPAERDLFVMLLSWVTYVALGTWVFYIALEPHVRRVWPEMMIGWSRLLTGRFRDPLVGRDILIGALAGIVLTMVIQLGRMAPAWFGLPPPLPTSASAQLLLGGRHALSELVVWQGRAVVIGLVLLLALILVNVLLRGRRLAVAATVLMLTMSPVVPSLAEGNPIFDLVLGGAWATGAVFVPVRFGLLAMIVSQFVFQLTSLVPITFDLSAPYISSSYLCLGTVIVLAAYGFHTAMGGRPVFGAGFLHDEPAQPGFT